jgi:beta-lactamase regulating signal transducer with metallopeptidase domain
MLSWNAANIVIALWLGGVLFLVLRVALAMLRLRSVVNGASPAPPEVQKLIDETRELMEIDAPVRAFVTEAVAVPMIWGVRAGTLLLPLAAESWSEEEQHATIVHELGHLQRLDYVALAVMNLVTALFWFHPQVWIARRRALSEGEHACDDLVLRSGARASDYASHLLSVARLMPRREPLSAILAMSRPSQLEGRMFSILSPSINRKPVGGTVVMASTVTFLLLAAPLAAFQLAAQPAAPITPLTPSAVGVAEARHDSASGDHKSSRHSSTHRSRSETGTCADYDHDFNTKGSARGEQTLTVGGNRLDITGAENGGVTLRRGTGNTFGITVCKAAGAISDEAAKQMLTQIDVQERGGKVSASGPEDSDWSVDLIVTVPDNRSISVVGHNGPISVGDVNGTIDARVENGPLSFQGSRGEIKASAQNGPLSLSELSGNVDASTVNGPLSISLDGTAWVGGELRASVQNGPLTVSMPRAYQTGVSVSALGHAPFSCHGDICRDVPDHDVIDNIPLKATLGNGPTRVFIQGGNGPVSLREKD